MEDDEKRTRHRSEGQEALCKIADSLFHYVVGNPDGFTLVGIVLVCHLTGDAQCRSVERCLWDKAVGKGNSEKTANKGRETEKPKVPVEASWLPKRELRALGHERRDWRGCQR